MLEGYQHPTPMAEDFFMKYDIPAHHGYFIIGTTGTGNPRCVASLNLGQKTVKIERLKLTSKIGGLKFSGKIFCYMKITI